MLPCSFLIYLIFFYFHFTEKTGKKEKGIARADRARKDTRKRERENERSEWRNAERDEEKESEGKWAREKNDRERARMVTDQAMAPGYQGAVGVAVARARLAPIHVEGVAHVHVALLELEVQHRWPFAMEHKVLGMPRNITEK
jgi:hypothetical protein